MFPTRLFKPSSLAIRLIGQAQSGGVAASGEVQFADLAGGGRWVADFGETPLWTPAKVKAWRALAAAADGGATPILVPLADRRGQPLSNPLVTPDPFGLTVYDDGLTPWTPDQVTATTTADMALRATSADFTFSAPKALSGGEHFAVSHATWGWRLYRIIRVDAGGLGSGDATTVTFRPPLREATAAGALLNFDSPRCVMRADGDIDLTLTGLRRGQASARFVEQPTPA